MYDVIIIGSGPAGLTAGIYIKRAGYNVLIVSKNEGALTKTNKIENYYGFENAISGKELMENGLKQAKRLEINIIEKEVVGIKYTDGDEYEVIVANQTKEEKYIAKIVVIATGAGRNKPNIKGVQEFEGKGISYCAVCDAPFYKNKKVAVLGEGQYAFEEAEKLLPLASSVTMLTDGKQKVENRSVYNEKLEINDKKIREFRGFENIEEIEFEDGTTEKISGIFIAQGIADSLDFAKKLGAQIKDNCIVVDKNMETTIPNIYACGDCTGGILQISKATYDGTKAGLAIINCLRNKL